jgi:hypothetical protein
MSRPTSGYGLSQYRGQKFDDIERSLEQTGTRPASRLANEARDAVL